MLTITCPITGTQHRHKNFGEANYKLDILHPLLLAPVDQLLKVKYPYDVQEQYILTVAYLWQINHVANWELVLWNGKPDLEKLGPIWMSQIFGTLRTFVHNLAMGNKSTAARMFPQLRIDASTTNSNIQSWLDVCNQLRKDYAGVMDLEKATTASRLFQAHIDAKGMYHDSIVPEETQKVRYVRTLKEYIERSFYNFELEKITLIGKIVLRPNDYEITTLKQVKALVLDYGMEATQEDYNHKSKVLLTLDRTLMDKLTILEALDLESDDLAAIRNTYTVEHEGQLYSNSIVSTKFAREAISKETVTSSKVYTCEPKREEFKSDFAYKVAYRTWRMQDGN